MRFPKFRHAISCGAVLGLVIPLLITALDLLRIFTIPESLVEVMWPSSIMLMATETLGYSWQAFAILAWSTVWNVLLYVVVFTLIWSVSWLFLAWRTSLRDGKTI